MEAVIKGLLTASRPGVPLPAAPPDRGVAIHHPGPGGAAGRPCTSVTPPGDLAICRSHPAGGSGPRRNSPCVAGRQHCCRVL